MDSYDCLYYSSALSVRNYLGLGAAIGLQKVRLNTKFRVDGESLTQLQVAARSVSWSRETENTTRRSRMCPFYLTRVATVQLF